MERLVSLGAVLAFVSFWHTSAQQSVGTVVVDDGRIGVGLISGGNFGPGSFSIGGSPGGRPQSSVYVNKDNEDGQHIIIQTHHKSQEENYQTPQSGGGNTKLYPVQPQTIHANSEEGGGNGDEEGSGSGQILIGAVVLNNNKQNKVNRKQNGNKQPELDAATLEAIFGSNGGNNDVSSNENGYSSTGEQESIQIDSITGGNFEEGTYNIDSNKKTATNALKKGNAVNNGNAGNPYEGNEAQNSKGHGANHNFAGKAGIGSSHRETKSDYNSGNSEEPWIWDR